MTAYIQTVILNTLICLGATVAVSSAVAVAVIAILWSTDAIMRGGKQAHIFFMFCVWNHSGRPSADEVDRLRAVLNRIRFMSSDEINEIVNLCDDALQHNP